MTWSASTRRRRPSVLLLRGRQPCWSWQRRTLRFRQETGVFIPTSLSVGSAHNTIVATAVLVRFGLCATRWS